LQLILDDECTNSLPMRQRRKGNKKIKYRAKAFFIALKQLYTFIYRSTIKELLTVNE